jgi:hypothetical protein
MPVRERLAAPASVDPSIDDWDANLVQLPEPLERPFELVSEFEPAGGQPEAIAKLVEGLEGGEAYQQGKTFTMANVIERTQRPR